MANTSSGVKPQKSLSRRMTRAPSSMVDLQNNDEKVIDSELVPFSLAPIIPILRVANEIQPSNPRVAYLCRFHAFEKVYNMDPNSSGRGVRQFKTYLLHRLETVGQACRPLLKRVGFWDSLVELARAYDYIMGLIVFLPIAILSWIPVVSEFQTRMLFHQAFSRGLQIPMILRKEKTT